ncbi:hypothetical protein KSP40_PGU001288 [Platanthera guangdongensis]|uniref:Uncharacterized protein n=1 Tax=Platanthera guangdongensis TaxID=2320717 RepID=A0ABR2MLP6_9ASPA
MGFHYHNDELFCGKHRHSDRHGCCFDYKPAGQINISRDNTIGQDHPRSLFLCFFPEIGAGKELLLHLILY